MRKYFRRFVAALCTLAMIICGATGAAGAPGTVPAEEETESFSGEEAFSLVISQAESVLNGLYAFILKADAGKESRKSFHLEIEPAALRLLNVISETVIKADSSWIKSLSADLIPGESDWTFWPQYDENNYQPVTIGAQGMAGRLCLNGNPVLEAGFSMNDGGLTFALPRVVSGGYNYYMDERTAMEVNDTLRAVMNCADLLPSAQVMANVFDMLGEFAACFQPEEIEEGPAYGYYDNVYTTCRFHKSTVSVNKLQETLTYIADALEGDQELKGQISHMFEGLKEYPYLSSMIDADDLLRDLAYSAGKTGIDSEEVLSETEEETSWEEYEDAYEYETEEDFSGEAGDLIMGALKEEILELAGDLEGIPDDYQIVCTLLYDLQGHLIGITIGGDIYRGYDSLLDIRWIVNEDVETNDTCVFSIRESGHQLLLLSGYKNPETGEYAFSFPIEYLMDGQLDSLNYQRYTDTSISFQTMGIGLDADGSLSGTLVIDKIPGLTLLQGMKLEICLDEGTVSLKDDTAVYLTLSVKEEETDAKEIGQILAETNRQRYGYNFAGNWNIPAIANRLLDAGMPEDFFKGLPAAFNDILLRR